MKLLFALFLLALSTTGTLGFRRGLRVFLARVASQTLPSADVDPLSTSHSSLCSSSSGSSGSWMDRYVPPDQRYSNVQDNVDDHHHHHHSEDDETDENQLLQIPCGLSLTQDTSNNKNSRSEPPHPRTVQAYLDTGAQRTVMSWEAAERTGFLLTHLDRRYAGKATGVGSCAVLGRIPAGVCQLHMGGGTTVPSPAITVIESTGTDGVDFLLGLDFLRDHQAIIDLRAEEMRVKVKGKSKVVAFIRPRGDVDPTTGASEERTTCFSPDQVESDIDFDDDAEDDNDDNDEEERLDMSGV